MAQPAPQPGPVAVRDASCPSWTDDDWHTVDELIRRADYEDVRHVGDITSLATVDQQQTATATFLAKDDGVLSGCTVAQRICSTMAPSLAVAFTRQDGEYVTRGTPFGTVHGPTRDVLRAERILLNVMQRMSGIATFTRSLVSLMDSSVLSLHHRRPCRLLDTRKTAPGCRILDKMAVRHGGGYNHRLGLYDMVMIKDNHIMASGGISRALSRVHAYLQAHASSSLPIEVEARTLEEVRELLLVGGFHRIMLDNMVTVHRDEQGTITHIDTSLLTQAVHLIHGRYETEASGNISADTIRLVSQCGVDYISCGALTHSVKAMDISLKIKQQHQHENS